MEMKNMAHSVSQRLRNLAKENREDFNLILVRYGMERFLYRLSTSRESERFVLKGASLFLVWKGQNYRVTRDADLLAFGESDIESIRAYFTSLCKIDSLYEDGMLYLEKTIRVEEIREDKAYEGVRVIVTGILGQARIPIQIDIGFGDAITPAPERVEFPTLLNSPAPILNAYPRYTLVAEKLEAMVYLGLANSRMKDFYDIWLVSHLFEFDAKILVEAVRNTFNRRGTDISREVPFALTSAFYDDAQKQVQWRAFIKKSKPGVEVGTLPEVVTEIKEFLLPILGIIHGEPLSISKWETYTGWVLSHG